jgi:magnesium chelatase ATPase subunit I
MQQLQMQQQRGIARRGATAAPRTAARRRLAVVAAAAVDAPAAATSTKRAFPFVRIQSQDQMKLALLLNVVDPNIGGVLIMGDRGTGKSVAVRAVAELLPALDVVDGDPFNSSPTDPKLMGPDALARYRAGEALPSVKRRTPLVELPLGATEDRVCGTIDIEKALSEGVKAYEPGLLAKANRGILYVDEVNLLDDGLVDVVLDAAAGGLNTVEREGVSIVHPARFIFIGSGNPAEGELRPQLLDRFGLSVSVGTLVGTEERTNMVLDRLAFEADPDAFAESCREETEALAAQLDRARQRLRDVQVPQDLQLLISEVCSRADVDGLRGDLVVNRAARALVALEGSAPGKPANGALTVTKEDVGRVVGMCLNHRMRKDPLDPIDGGTKVTLIYQRLSDPEFRKREEEAARKKAEAEAAAAKEAPAKKAGAWGGLPPSRR